jgi:hypothetical protein
MRRFAGALAASLLVFQSGNVSSYAAAVGPSSTAAAVVETAVPAAAAGAVESLPSCPIGDMAGLFGGNEDEGPEPFTLYGA